MKDSLIIVLIFLLSVGLSLISPAEETTVEIKSQKEKAPPIESPTEKKVTLLTIKASSGNAISVELTNSVPVRAVQFTVTGVKMTELRTTKRTAGFLAKFNEENGRVVVLSTSEDRIAPGKGSIAEIICGTPGSAQLSGVEIVGSNSKSL